MTRTLPLVAAIALVLSSGVAQGLWAHRWTASHELEAAVDQLNRIPRNIGDWEGEDQAFDQRQLKEARISGHMLRRYRNRRDGSVVNVLLMCGRTGPLAVHTPDICYQGVGYDMESEPKKQVMQAEGKRPRVELYRADFRKENSVVPQGLRIYWLWTATGTWKAPNNPRLAFAGFPVLYKLYVMRETGEQYDSHARIDPSLELIEALLPVLQTSLFSPS